MCVNHKLSSSSQSKSLLKKLHVKYVDAETLSSCLMNRQFLIAERSFLTLASETKTKILQLKQEAGYGL